MSFTVRRAAKNLYFWLQRPSNINPALNTQIHRGNFMHVYRMIPDVITSTDVDQDGLLNHHEFINFVSALITAEE